MIQFSQIIIITFIYMFIYLSSHRQSTTRRTDTSLKRRIKTHWETRKVEQVLQFDSWIKNGKLHRVGDAPAFIRYYKNGNIQNEAWIKNGKYHRIDAPANIEYFVTGEILAEEWFKNDKHHPRRDLKIGLSIIKV